MQRATGNYSYASDSHEPTVSGFSQMPEDRDRENKAIVAEDPIQYEMFKAIENIDSIYLIPWGRLPDIQHPETKRFVWLRRTPKSIRPVVWCRINAGGRDVLFEVEFSRRDYFTAHVPFDSWIRRTCDPEAVRAAIQQDYLNRLRGVRHHTTIVKQGMESLRLFKPIPVPSFATGNVIDDVPRSFARNSVQMQVSYEEHRQYRARSSRPLGSQYHEVYSYHHARRNYDTSEPYSPTQTLVEEYTHGYSRRHHYHTSEQSSRSGYSSRTLVDEDWTRKFEDDYSDISSSAGRARWIPPPPLRSEKHGWGLAPSFRSDSGDSSIYSELDDDIHPRERKRWWQRIL